MILPKRNWSFGSGSASGSGSGMVEVDLFLFRCFARVGNLTNISDFYIESSEDAKLLTNLFDDVAGFAIDDKGQLTAYMSVVAEVSCGRMDFAAYPRDKHECEFFIASTSYTQARNSRANRLMFSNRSFST